MSVRKYDIRCHTSDYQYGATAVEEDCENGDHVAASAYDELKAKYDALEILVSPIVDAWVESRPEEPVLPVRNLEALAYMMGKVCD
jgi:hypothetical protein